MFSDASTPQKASALGSHLLGESFFNGAVCFMRGTGIPGILLKSLSTIKMGKLVFPNLLSRLLLSDSSSHWAIFAKHSKSAIRYLLPKVKGPQRGGPVKLNAAVPIQDI